MLGIKVELVSQCDVGHWPHEKLLTFGHITNMPIIDESFMYNLFLIEHCMFYEKWDGFRYKCNI